MSESIEDIVREMRERSQAMEIHGTPHGIKVAMQEFADRIEAAVKALEADRDNWRRQALDEDARANATHKDSLAVGDMAAMREALQEIQLVCWKAGGAISYAVACGIIKAKSRAALAKPPRNCEVGTTEEQIKGWQKFCDKHFCCKECDLNRDGDLTAVCFARWSQMPYEEVK